jgi:hypothetical protein
MYRNMQLTISVDASDLQTQQKQRGKGNMLATHVHKSYPGHGFWPDSWNRGARTATGQPARVSVSTLSFSSLNSNRRTDPVYMQEIKFC